MTPSHARKQGLRYRYYVSAALVQGQAERAGTITRVAANEIETLVVRAVRNHLNESATTDDRELINTHLIRVEVKADHLAVELKESIHSPMPRHPEATDAGVSAGSMQPRSDDTYDRDIRRKEQGDTLPDQAVQRTRLLHRNSADGRRRSTGVLLALQPSLVD
jgi:hypothetical protein